MRNWVVMNFSMVNWVLEIEILTKDQTFKESGRERETEFNLIEKEINDIICTYRCIYSMYVMFNFNSTTIVYV